MSIGLNPVSVEAAFTVYQGGKETSRRCSGKLIEQPCTKPLKMVVTILIIVVVMVVLMKMMTMTMVRQCLSREPRPPCQGYQAVAENPLRWAFHYCLAYS